MKSLVAFSIACNVPELVPSPNYPKDKTRSNQQVELQKSEL